MKDKSFKRVLWLSPSERWRFCSAKPAPIPQERKLSPSESHGHKYDNFGKKTRFSLLIYSELIAGILCYVLVAAVTGLLIWSAINSEERIDDIVTVIIILAVFYLLCAVGGGWLISRFIKWKKLPDDLISADGEYLYIFTNKQIKIALNEIDSIFAGPESFLIQLFGGGYGIVEIKAVGKKYKVYFVDEANTVPDIVMNHINNL